MKLLIAIHNLSVCRKNIRPSQVTNFDVKFSGEAKKERRAVKANILAAAGKQKIQI